METTDVFEYTPFVNEECGDTMWNEENLNPPKSSAKKDVSVENIKTENKDIQHPSEDKSIK